MFDFDGLIVDTEEPIYRSWLEVYHAHGQDLPFDRWIQTVGSSNATFDPRGHLEERLGRPLTQAVVDRRIERRTQLVLEQPLRPGVQELLDTARKVGLRVGVASSSSCNWVRGHLERFGLLDRLDCIRCRDDVARVKPAPDLYLAVLECLGVKAEEAIAIEDSPNGIAAAKDAGMWCVGIPNVMTGGLDLGRADFVLTSLAGQRPADLAGQLGLKLWA